MVEDCPEYIIKHRVNEFGETQYYVKWIGCDISDNTWESKEKLLTEWPEAVQRYNTRMETNSHIQHTPPENADKVFAYTKSVADWEESVERIVFVEKSKLPGLTVYIQWKNGYKSIHHSTEVYAKCPQKMLDYFESHWQFKIINHNVPM